MKTRVATFSLLFTVPLFAYAFPGQNVGEIARFLVNMLRPVLAIFTALAVLFFLWGLVKFIYKSGETKDHSEGARFMLWGVVALFVMVSLWAIVSFAQRELGLRESIIVPSLPTNVR